MRNIIKWAKSSELFYWFSFFLSWTVLWALLFGMTINGKHYGFNGCAGCFVDKIEFDWGK